MEAEKIKLVQDSFAKVAPISDTAASLFYSRLFELDPSLRALFKSDLTDQGKKLMQMLGVAVKGLTDLDSIIPAVKSLAERHVTYGVEASQYDTVGEALIWTLGQGLGDEFTDEVKGAWVEVYGLLTSVMLPAAEAVGGK